jgi:hypothetical protein
LATGKMLQDFQGHRDGIYHAVFDAGQTRVLSVGAAETWQHPANLLGMRRQGFKD